MHAQEPTKATPGIAARIDDLIGTWSTPYTPGVPLVSSAIHNMHTHAHTGNTPMVYLNKVTKDVGM